MHIWFSIKANVIPICMTKFDQKLRSRANLIEIRWKRFVCYFRLEQQTVLDTVVFLYTHKHFLHCRVYFSFYFWVRILYLSHKTNKFHFINRSQIMCCFLLAYYFYYFYYYNSFLFLFFFLYLLLYFDSIFFNHRIYSMYIWIM